MFITLIITNVGSVGKGFGRFDIRKKAAGYAAFFAPITEPYCSASVSACGFSII